MSKNYHLENLIPLEYYMRILIDESVETDDNGNFLINIGYIRVSTDRQAELGYGLDIQERDVYSYCVRNNFKNLIIFADDGYTGTDMDRPALRGVISMINDFNEGKSKLRVNSIIIPKIDRLARTLLGTLQFIQDYIVAETDSKNSLVNKNKEDINFISVSENYCRIERNNPQGKFLLMLFASLAEFDRDLIVEKLAKGRTARISSGKWMGGGKVPYGYRYDKEQGILVTVPEEAEKVKEIFRLYTEEKMSPQKISDRLGFKGERIVTQILKRKSLTGCVIYKGVEYRGMHEPIIPLETWLEAQEEIKNRSVFRGERCYLLSGLLRCGECGAKMRYQKWDKNTGECKLVCYSRQKSKAYLVKDENCDNQLFWQSDIENAVVSELFKLTYLGDEKNIKTENFVDPIEVLTKQLANQKKKLSRLYDFEDENQEDDVLDEKIQNCRRRIREIETQIQAEREQYNIARKVDKARKIFESLSDAWETMTQKERQAVCQELIDEVIIYKNGTADVKLKLKNYIENRINN